MTLASRFPSKYRPLSNDHTAVRAADPWNGTVDINIDSWIYISSTRKHVGGVDHEAGENDQTGQLCHGCRARVHA